MRNAIRYFYNIYCTDIIKNNNNYKILLNNDIYYLVLFNGDISLVNYIYKYLISNNIYCHEIILNKDNQYITTIENENYILLKIHSEIKKITFSDIVNFDIMIEKNKKCNWYQLWCEKLDYYEYQMSQFKKKYPKLYESFSYYSGLSETAISLASSIKNENVNLYINHKRILKNCSSIDFYNPANMIFDVKVRDVCEYFKNQFFYVENPLNEVRQYLDYIKLSKEEAILFLSRLIYPSYYFDLYDEIIQDRVDEDRIDIILKKTNDYELFIKEMYSYMNFIYRMPEIEWLIKT